MSTQASGRSLYDMPANDCHGFAVQRQENVPRNAWCPHLTSVTCTTSKIVTATLVAKKKRAVIIGQPTCSCHFAPHKSLYLLLKCRQALAQYSFWQRCYKCRIPAVEQVTLQCIADTCSTKRIWKRTTYRKGSLMAQRGVVQKTWVGVLPLASAQKRNGTRFLTALKLSPLLLLTAGITKSGHVCGTLRVQEDECLSSWRFATCDCH